MIFIKNSINFPKNLSLFYCIIRSRRQNLCQTRIFQGEAVLDDKGCSNEKENVRSKLLKEESKWNLFIEYQIIGFSWEWTPGVKNPSILQIDHWNFPTSQVFLMCKLLWFFCCVKSCIYHHRRMSLGWRRRHIPLFCI